MAPALQQRLTGLLEARGAADGFDVVLVEVAGGGRNPVVRVYLDHEGGITIDQITVSNRWVKEVLDAMPEFGAGYTLEVSSPGIERPLVKLADFVRFTGSRAKLSLAGEIAGRKHVTGMITGVEGSDVLLDVEGEPLRIPHSVISRARLRVEIDFSKEGTADDGI